MHICNNVVFIFQNALDEMMISWNCHKIRSYRNQLLLSGRPWMLHSMPQIYGTTNYAMPVDEDDIETYMVLVQQKSDVSCCPVVHDICVLIIEECNLPVPEAADEMYELYIFLRNSINWNLWHRPEWECKLNHLYFFLLFKLVQMLFTIENDPILSRSYATHVVNVSFFHIEGNLKVYCIDHGMDLYPS